MASNQVLTFLTHNFLGNRCAKNITSKRAEIAAWPAKLFESPLPGQQGGSESGRWEDLHGSPCKR
jgi:hypothetical protein